jgi:transcriptional regulatory protein GAL4
MPVLILYRNLDAAELRCAKLISLVQRLDPEIDINAALDLITGTGAGEPTASLERPEALESEPERAHLSDRFEWSEVANMSPSHLQKDVPDGMVVLPTERTDAGYLGKIFYQASGTNLNSC